MLHIDVALYLSFRSVHALSHFYYVFSCYLTSTKPGLGNYIAVVTLAWVVQ
jgi:hypothetical protein